MISPVISVIMAVYNGENRVISAIQSVIDQDIDNWELLIIDDGSTDATKQVVKQVDDSRVFLITLERNVGPGAARNIGLRAARGEWVTFLDHDDRFEPKRLSTLLAIGKRTGCDVVADDQLVIDEYSRAAIGHTFGGITNRTAEWPLSLMGFLDHCPVMQPMIRTEFLRKHDLAFPEDRQYLEDLHLWIEILLHGAKWICISNALYRYTYRKGSLSHKRGELNRQRARSLAALARQAEERGFLCEATRMRALAREADLAASAWDFIESVQRRQFRNAIHIVGTRPKVLTIVSTIVFRWIGCQVNRRLTSLFKV